MYNVFGESTVVGYAVRSKSDYNYKTDFEILRGNQEFELQKNARSQTHLNSTPVGAKTTEPKTPAIESSAQK